MQRQTLIDESVVCRQQIEDAAIFADDTVDEQFHFTLECFAQRLIEVRKLNSVRIDVVDIAHLQPLERKIRNQRLRFWISQQPSDLLLEDPGIRKFSCRCDVEKLIVGQPAPKEERQPGGEFEAADLI